MPFTHDQFLDVFGAYNSALWPAAVALWLATAWMAIRWLGRGSIDARPVLALLSIHWLWSGVAYHWSFFRSINPAAAIFAAFFVAQGAILAWLAVASNASASPASLASVGSPVSPASLPPHFAWALNARGVLGSALVVYGLAYPFVGVAAGLNYPRMPAFAVPCPTTIVTAGLLVCASGLRRAANIIPLLWSVVASSAAFALGIYADLALIFAAFVLVLDTLAPSALGARGRVEAHAGRSSI